MSVLSRTTIKISAIALAVVFSGCASYDNRELAKSGPGSDFHKTALATFRENQDKVLQELTVAAGVTGPPATAMAPGDWDKIIAAGMDYADERCEAYLQALFRLNRDKKTAVSQLGLLGGVTAGIQAALDTAAKNVAITALLFGLSSSSVDNLTNNLLFELEPSSIRTIVKALQSSYRQGLGVGYMTRSAAVSVIRGYATLCVPANIESEVNLAVRKARPEARKGEPAKGQPPVVTNAQVVAATFTFGVDDSSTVLDAFVFPGGTLDSNNRRRLEDFLRTEKLPGIDPVTFINSAEFTETRKRAVKQLGLK